MSEGDWDPTRRSLLVGLGAVMAGLAMVPFDAEALMKARAAMKALPLPPAPRPTNVVATSSTTTRIVATNTAAPGTALPGPPPPRPARTAVASKPAVSQPAGTSVAQAGTKPPAQVTQVKVAAVPPRRLRLYNIHTLESIDAPYFVDGRYDPRVLKKLNVFMRDHYANKVGDIDPRVYDVLFSVQTTLRSNQPFRVISGYRSPATNRALRAESNNVALRSYHMKGMAIDVMLPDRRVAAIAQCAYAMRCGGVGVYRGSGFVHLDVGPFRTWSA